MAQPVGGLLTVGLLNEFILHGELLESEIVFLFGSEAESVFCNMGHEFLLHEGIVTGDLILEAEEGGCLFKKVHI